MGVLAAMDTEPRLVALIPARAGSKRLPGKNVRYLAGEPLVAYAIAAAREAGIFQRIAVSTDDGYTADFAASIAGVEAINRPAQFAGDDSPDIEWLQHALTICTEYQWRTLPNRWGSTVYQYAPSQIDGFAIIRPTSPFRRGAWIRAAWQQFLAGQPADSLRAVRPVQEHAAKCWRPVGRFLLPLLPFDGAQAPWHSMPTQELPELYVQTAALEIAWCKTVREQGTIAGALVLPWITEIGAPEALDINTLADWERAQSLAAEHPEYLPEVRA